MKLECLKENILHALSLAERMTGKNLPLEVLSNILLVAEKNTLIIRSTNLDLGIEVHVPAKIETEGTVAVPGAVLQNFIANVYESHSISLAYSENKLTITSESSTAVVNTHPHDDFPTLPKIEDGISFSIPSNNFINGLKSVWYSASHSTIKPELASVYVYPKENTLIFVATDSFRLAEKTVGIKKNLNFDPILIPIKNIPEIIKVLESSNEEVEVNISGAQIAFSMERVYLTSRLTEGSFPDYKQIIPKEFKTEVIVLKQDILQTLKTSSIFLDKFSQIQVDIDPKKKKFTIKTHNSEVGEHTTNLNATVNGDELSIYFNHKYLLDCFQSIPADSTTFSFSGPGKPLVISGVSDQSFRYLVMPMNK